MKLLVIGGIVVLLLMGGGGAWWFFFSGNDAATSAEHEATAAPIYVELGRFQVPVFDGGALAGHIFLDAVLHVADQQAKEAVAGKVTPVRDAMLHDLFDAATLTGLTGQSVALERLKARLQVSAARAVGPDHKIELLIQSYVYTPV